MGRRPEPGAAGWRAARRRPAVHASAAHLDDALVVRCSAAAITTYTTALTPTLDTAPVTAIPSWGSTVAAAALTAALAAAALAASALATITALPALVTASGSSVRR